MDTIDNALIEGPKIKKRRGPPPGVRHGGRTKGSLNKKTVALLDLAEQMGLASDPVRYLLSIIGCDGCVRVPVIDATTGKQARGEDGKPLTEWKAISTRQKLDACREIMPFLRPKLSARQVTGANQGPVEVNRLDIAQILQNPELARNAQELALRVIEQQGAGDGQERAD